MSDINKFIFSMCGFILQLDLPEPFSEFSRDEPGIEIRAHVLGSRKLSVRKVSGIVGADTTSEKKKKWLSKSRFFGQFGHKNVGSVSMETRPVLYCFQDCRARPFKISFKNTRQNCIPLAQQWRIFIAKLPKKWFLTDRKRRYTLNDVRFSLIFKLFSFFLHPKVEPKNLWSCQEHIDKQPNNLRASFNE